MSSEPVAAVGALAASGFMDCARVCRNCLSLAAMSVAGLSAGVLVVLGCSAANNLVKAASRRLPLTAGVAGVADATGVVVLAVAVSVAAVVVVDAGAGIAVVLVAADVAATLAVVEADVEVVDAVELAAGAPSVWAS